MPDATPIRRVPNEMPPFMYENVRCSKCNEPVRMVGSMSEEPLHTAMACIQPIDGLHLVNFYGYGMKWDNPEGFGPFELGLRDVVLCPTCTDRFLVDNQWLERYLKP